MAPLHRSVARSRTIGRRYYSRAAGPRLSAGSDRRGPPVEREHRGVPASIHLPGAVEPHRRPDIGNGLDHRSRRDPATQRRYSIRPAPPRRPNMTAASPGPIMTVTVRPNKTRPSGGVPQTDRIATSRSVEEGLGPRPSSGPGLAPPRAAGLASALCASRCVTDRGRPPSRRLCPQEGGRSRRSNFLAALNVLGVRLGGTALAGLAHDTAQGGLGSAPH